MSDYEKLTDHQLVQKCMLVGILPNWYNRCDVDDNAARLVRDRIAELKIVDRWAMQLDRMVWDLPGIDPDMTLSSNPGSLMRYMNATPRQQCIAALLALVPQTSTDGATEHAGRNAALESQQAGREQS